MSTLIKTNEEVRNFVPVNIGSEFTNFQPYYDKIARSVLRDSILGATAYNELLTAYDADNLTSNQQTLLEYCQDVIVNLGLEKFIEPGTVQISDVISVPYSEQSQVVSQNRKYDLKRQFKIDGHDALERLLRYLWTDGGTVFSGFWASQNRKDHRNTVILDSIEFKTGFQIGNGFYAFTLLKSAIARAEELYLVPTIGQDFYDELKLQIRDKTLTPENETLMPWIRKALAPLAVFVGLNELGINIDELGVTIDGLSDRDNTVKRDPADLSRYGMVISRAEKIGQSFLNRLTVYLNDNASDSVYPTYYASDCYLSAEDKADTDLHINNEDSGLFMV